MTSKQIRLQHIYETIRRNPGLYTAEIARLTGIKHNTFLSYLPTLDNNGLLITEDEQGRIYPFDQERPPCPAS